MGNHLHWTQENRVELMVRQNHGRPQGDQNGHFPLPGNWDYEPKFSRKRDVSSSIPIN